MIKHKRIIFLLTIILLIANISKVEATGINIRNVDFSQLGGSSGGSGTGTGERPKQNSDYRPSSNDSRLYRCSYYNNITRNRQITTNAYDINKTSLIPNSFEIPNNIELLSGTWIGINVSEYKYVRWNFTDFEYKEIKKEYTCYYSKPGTTTISYDDKCIIKTKDCPSGYRDTNEDCDVRRRKRTCRKTIYTQTPGGSTTRKVKTAYYSSNVNCPYVAGYNFDRHDSGTEIEENSTNYTQNEACKHKAIKNDISAALNYLKYASVNLIYTSTNKASEIGTSNGQSIINEYKRVEGETKTKIQEINDNMPSSGISYATYEIGPSKVCIDTITGNVYYNTNCDNKKKEIPNETLYEDSIKDYLNFWHYFIPLDIKTQTSFSIKLTDKNGEILTKEQCEYVMQNYSNYKDIIQPVIKNTGEVYGTYIGDYRYGNIDKNLLKTSKLSCSFATAINFGKNIVQRFYGEEKKSRYTSLKGYNVYFRQIDIKNPFPNNIASTSIWNGIYNISNNKVNTGNGQIKLSDFDDITYRTEVSNQNADKIRTFNNSTPYTKWTKDFGKQNGMNSDGTSNFVRNNGTIFTKISSKNSFYNLGCGPANKDWSGCS